jgi:lipid-binding SYLF domain-containing protein
MKKLTLLIGASSIIFIACAVAAAQKADAPATKRAEKKFAHAVERSTDAGRIISLLALLPDSGFPRELMDRAVAVGVFPKVEKETALFMHGSQGYGVISARREDGWTAPAFYGFAGGSFGKPFAKAEVKSLILLFMTKDAVAAFEKGGVGFEGNKKAVAGPVGAISDEQRKALEGAQILAYYYYNGKLEGNKLEKGFLSNFGLNPDNNINTPLYGMKGRQVLTGKKVDPSSLPSGLLAFPEALQKYYGETKSN